MASGLGSMFGRPLVLFRIRGIEIALHPSWLITVTFLSLFFKQELVPKRFGGAAAAGIAVGLTLLFYLFVLLHEFAHTLVALRYRLDPRRIVLFMLGGVSQIGKEASEPRQEYYVALAGPLASMVIGGALLFVSAQLHPSEHGFGGVWGRLALLNLALAVFNMIPGFPLDGGRVFRSMVWAISGSRLKATRWAAAGGRIVAVGFVAGGIVFGIIGSADRNRFMGIWYVVLGWFLYSMAANAGRLEVEREALRLASNMPVLSGPLAGDIVAGEPALARDIAPAPRKRAAVKKKRAVRARPEVRKRVTPAKRATRLKAAPSRPALKAPAISTGRPVKRKTNESDAAKSDSRRRARRRAKRARPAAPPGAQSRNRSGDSGSGSPYPRRGTGGRGRA